ncbi:MAG: tyrosine-type recombinase/integrase [Gammaproteobacteria bacterium]
MLSDTKARQARPREKPYKLADQGGLYLLVSPTGAKSWRYDYRLHGRRETLTLGSYPELALAEARERHLRARKRVAQGESPAQQKRTDKRAAVEAAAGTFEAVAEKWYGAKAPHRSRSWRESTRRWLDKELYPSVGNKPLGEITPADVLAVMKAMEARGAGRSASYVRLLVSQVYQHAIRNLLADYDPAQSLRGALVMPGAKHRAPLLSRDIPAFIEALDADPGKLQVRLGIKQLLLTFVRKQELVQATWDEVDFARAEWRIPAERRKMRDPHIVPLSRQALECFRDLQQVACGSRYVLPHHGSLDKPMGSNTINKAFDRMGYRGRFTPHGLRATASTLLNEMGFRPDVIERQLAHTERNRIRAAYNRAEYMDERRRMMQAWADYLDSLKAGAELIPLRARR